MLIIISWLLINIILKTDASGKLCMYPIGHLLHKILFQSWDFIEKSNLS